MCIHWFNTKKLLTVFVLAFSSIFFSCSDIDTNNPPTIPGHLEGTVNGSEVTLTWDASTDNIGVTGYTIYKDYSFLVSSDTNRYVVQNLAQGTYEFQVSAYDGEGNESDKSNTVSVDIASGVTDDYEYTDNVPGSATPPGGLSASQAPMFVSIGWDDNAISGTAGTKYEGGGVRWIIDFLDTKTNAAGIGNKRTYDGTPVHNTFYNISNPIIKWSWDDPAYVRDVWRELMEKGHEIGNHTRTHLKYKNGESMTEDQWFEEVNNCIEDFKKPYPNEGLGLTRLFGFRAPRMEFNNNLYLVMKRLGIMYDCSGVYNSQESVSSDGKGYYWPYTLDNGLPGKSSVSSHSGIWRMPKHGLIDTDGSNLSSTDYTLFKNGMDAQEFLSALKHTLGLRLESNRAPMIFGAHTELYTEGAESYLSVPQMTFQQRRDVIEAFLNYALTFDDVRIVSTKEILDWVRNPVALDDTTNNDILPDNSQYAP